MGGSAYCPFFCIAEGQHKQQQHQQQLRYGPSSVFALGEDAVG